MDGIRPNWPAPTWVHAVTTLRTEGASKGPFAGFNLGTHVNDRFADVQLNRLRLHQQLNLATEPVWLEQTHSTRVLQLPVDLNDISDADGSWTHQRNLPCVVLTADCLPLLLCDAQGTLVSAVHCGWRGLLNGIIENALQAIQPHIHSEILAWLGPAIGPLAFEVGSEVREAFIARDLRAALAFKPSHQPNKWMADIYLLAKLRLKQWGVNAIYGGDYCTYRDENRFYSYRRDHQTGRMATLIWLK